jgi:hypothetical protein
MLENSVNTLSVASGCFSYFSINREIVLIVINDFEYVINSSVFYQTFSFIKNDAPMLLMAFSWLLENAKKLEKHSLNVKKVFFWELWTHQNRFCASLWALLWPSFNHIMWFYWIGCHTSCKSFDHISFGIVLASLKGCLVPSLLVW